MGIRKIITNWQGLSNIMSDIRMNKNPIEISFKEDELESLTFETVKGYKRYEVKE